VEQLEARERFDSARFEAFRRALRAVLTGRTRRLMSLELALAAAGFDGQTAAGEQEISLDHIVGSAHQARTHDFDPGFLPTARRMRDRWSRVYAAWLRGAEMPPIDVYRVGDAYYVSDGHHRVSVARRLGLEKIKARVTDVRTRAPLPPGTDAGSLLRAAEYARFLELTHLDRVRPEARLDVSRLGRYDEILAHILGHRYFLGVEQNREVPLAEAAASWYDSVYLPVVSVLERHAAGIRFRGWTQTDLYVEITRRWLGGAGGPHEAVHALLDERSRRRYIRPPRI
jgi:hypothetical protein